jgi:mannobiose 2-epimerase
MFFEADWVPYSLAGKDRVTIENLLYYDHVSFGHDVETAYLLEEAEYALSGQVSERTLAVGKQLVDHALATGWDPGHGGFIHAGFYFPGEKTITRMNESKDWWAQAEGLNTLLIMADRYPNDERNYAQLFTAQWRYIDRWLIDHERGGWYPVGLDHPAGRADANKANIWKAAYHDGRALINVIRRLREPGT